MSSKKCVNSWTVAGICTNWRETFLFKDWTWMTRWQRSKIGSGNESLKVVKSEIPGPEKTRAVAVCRQQSGESIRRLAVPDEIVQEWFMDWELSRGGPKEEDQFQCFFPSCHCALMDVLKAVLKKKARKVHSFRHTAREESAPVSPAVNPVDSYWAPEKTPAGYMILYISC